MLLLCPQAGLANDTLARLIETKTGSFEILGMYKLSPAPTM